ncbi:phosphonate C-P lyase system protein PhnH [Alicyclobacillus fastidiosus]|uniref:Phosphonate C-P lyase system protein PhnH n=1 Tax=Alicyclobacillus fastidiosus TaxID=392011 RepID=A0ABY6ZQA1_9BACL|nr:phosphonate C-P lyase system protein PhnH [Alicyclobacillus fastidiosus]WAH44135.1 phosphonate C-P lyase system protein PhnH [Alicyclobacillus fastidiosus]GMA60437.1 phosphonate C-P lyase system protein PhnH [Alicyclobacillus fastidiosus]
MTTHSLPTISEQESATQELFRTLLDCMSRPGKIAKLAPSNGVLEIDLTPYVVSVALTLLDQEVTFQIVHDKGSSSSTLQVYTMASLAPLNQCDFVFMHGTDSVDVCGLKRGVLAYPDESATVVCSVNQLSDSKLYQSGTTKLTLSGPGIKDQCQLFLDGIDEQLLSLWQRANQEYPLGIDWIFVDEMGNVCCIPRSTQFAWEVM